MNHICLKCQLAVEKLELKLCTRDVTKHMIYFRMANSVNSGHLTYHHHRRPLSRRSDDKAQSATKTAQHAVTAYLIIGPNPNGRSLVVWCFNSRHGVLTLSVDFFLFLAGSFQAHSESLFDIFLTM